MTGTGDIRLLADGGGASILDDRRQVRLFRIVGGSNPYDANEVYLRESDGSRELTGVYQVTAAQKVLWEVNGLAGVPAGVVVIGMPNPAGTGFYFEYPACCIDGGGASGPRERTVITGICLDGNGGGYVRYLTIDIDTGDTLDEYCAPIPVCGSGDGGGLCDDLPDPGGPGSGGGGEGGITSCCPERAMSSELIVSLTFYGSMLLTWDGATFWVGSKYLSACGEWLWLRWGTSCVMEYSCNGSTWAACVSLGMSTDCGPPMIQSGVGWQANMDNTLIGCTSGGCGLITATSVQEV